MNRTPTRPWGRPGSSDPGAQNGAAFAASGQSYQSRGRGARPELVHADTPQGRRVVGAFVHRDGKQVLQKLVDVDAHMLKHPCPAWAVDCRALEEASRRGVRRVVLYDGRRGTWWARLADFEQHGVPVDRGHGAQLALGVQWFSFIPLGSVTPQLTLFAEARR